MKTRVIVFFFALNFFNVCLSQTSYITDDFEIMLRTGPSGTNKILEVLNSGTKVTSIKNTDNGYTKIKTNKGNEGYVLTRFLSSEPAAKSLVQQLQEQIKSLQNDPDKIRTDLLEKQKENKILIQQNTTLTDRLSSAEKELKQIKYASKNALKIAEKNASLEKETQTLLLEIDELRLKNKTYKQQSDQRWFILGASAITLGLILGWLLSVMKRPRRRMGGL